MESVLKAAHDILPALESVDSGYALERAVDAVRSQGYSTYLSDDGELQGNLCAGIECGTCEEKVEVHAHTKAPNSSYFKTPEACSKFGEATIGVMAIAPDSMLN